MIDANLRHLRVFLAVAEGGSITRAAELCHVSQPAVTQAIAKLEAEAGTALFTRTTHGLFATEAGEVLRHRTSRALDALDTQLTEFAPRLKLTATRAQLQALIAAAEAQNFSLAARRLGVSQPTVHRAITQLEKEAGRALFQRSPFGIVPTRGCANLARIARLAFVELEQARAELGDLSGREVGQIVIGAMPLSRSHVLPKAIVAFRKMRPNMAVKVLEGSYDELLGGLRRGEIDFLIGALRDPAPIGDVVQEKLFDDTLVVLAGRDHPLLGQPLPAADELANWPWLVTREGTPTRAQFEAFFSDAGVNLPRGLIETGSVILMREMVQDGRHLACVSRAQAEGEIERGLVEVLTDNFSGTRRPIGLTLRDGWEPTPAQAQMLMAVRST
ncbi:LysR family transcriptional regulator [Thioclava sediminum]|uniref:LysR family transcriptional regulator n=1 Tax=Thioclava sediminum TaxID=1915319 RepID=A0ABX3MYP7_9RHOB|nr:LysR family transcriptional regulator [Thioclava sediminum]OOY24756.1 LysR family transcriptional regulator [Thioclava sediminum]